MSKKVGRQESSGSSDAPVNKSTPEDSELQELFGFRRVSEQELETERALQLIEQAKGAQAAARARAALSGRTRGRPKKGARPPPGWFGSPPAIMILRQIAFDPSSAGLTRYQVFERTAEVLYDLETGVSPHAVTRPARDTSKVTALHRRLEREQDTIDRQREDLLSNIADLVAKAKATPAEDPRAREILNRAEKWRAGAMANFPALPQKSGRRPI